MGLCEKYKVSCQPRWLKIFDMIQLMSRIYLEVPASKHEELQ